MNYPRTADDHASIRSGSSSSSYSSRSSSTSASSDSYISTYSGSSSRRGAVLRRPEQHNNLAVRLAVHFLQGPLATKIGTSHRPSQHKKHGVHHSCSSSSSSSSKSGERYHQPPPPPNYQPDSARREPVRTAMGPPGPPPPPPGGRFAAGPGTFSNGQGFVQVNGQAPGGRVDPVWGNAAQTGGIRRGPPPPSAQLVNE